LAQAYPFLLKLVPSSNLWGCCNCPQSRPLHLMPQLAPAVIPRHRSDKRVVPIDELSKPVILSVMYDDVRGAEEGDEHIKEGRSVWGHVNQNMRLNASTVYRMFGGKAAEEAGLLWYPNRRSKKWHPGNDADPGGDDPSCDGIPQQCPFGKGSGKGMCWRVSYRSKIKEFRDAGGCFVQVVELPNTFGAVQELSIGEGQKEEAAWAAAEGIKVYHTINGNQLHEGLWDGFQGNAILLPEERPAEVVFQGRVYRGR